jgi:hypothetical protein
MVMAIVGVASAAAAEADLSGKWQLEIVSPQGTRTPTMTLKQDGTQVSGTYNSQRGDVPIAGSIQGADFTLTVKIEGQTEKLTVEYKGRVEGGTLTGRVMMGARGEAAFTGKRATT